MIRGNPRTERIARIAKEYQNIAIKYDSTKVGVCQTQNSKQDNQHDDAENKKMKMQNAQSDKDQLQRSYRDAAKEEFNS